MPKPMSTGLSAEPPGPGAQRPWLVLGIMCVGFFMALLDGSIVNIAIPELIHALDASYYQVLWVVDAYLLVFSVLLITTGRLGDRFGYRRMYVIGIVTFTVASALCGLSGSPAQLLAARVLQGFGTALLFPQVISTILTIFPARMRGRAFGVFGVIVGMAPIAGPVGGGLLLADLGWRWIFFVNVPIGVVTAILALVIVPPLRPGRAHKLDLTGVALITAGLSGIVFGLIEGPRYEWGTIKGPISIAGVIAMGAVLVMAFTAWQGGRQRRRDEPLMPLALFTVRNFSVGNGVGFVFQLGMIGIGFVLVLYLQSALGYSALRTGLVMLPMAVLTAIGSALAGRLSDKFGGTYVLMTGLVLLALGLLVLVAVSGPDADARTMMPALIVIGIAGGATFAPLQQATMDGTDPRLAGAASGVSSTTRQMGGVVGTAVVGVLLSARLTTTLHDEAGRRAERLPENLRSEFVDDVTGSARQFAPPSIPGGLDPSARNLYEHVAGETFAAGFTKAMDTTLLAAAATLILAALACLLFRTSKNPATPARADDEHTRTTPRN